MLDHPLNWAQIKVIDARPVRARRLVSAVRAAGYSGDVKAVHSKSQLLTETVVPGSALYLVADPAFVQAGIAREVLEFWLMNRCKVVFLEPGFEAFMPMMQAKALDFAPRAIDVEGGMAPAAIAKKILQFEPSAAKPIAPSPKPSAPEPLRPMAPKVRTPGRKQSNAQAAPRRVAAIGIGASTGGVEALQVVLKALPSNLPPIIIVQHTRNADGNSLVQVLNRATDLDVVKAEHNVPLMAGRVYVACGRDHHVRLDRSNLLRLHLTEEPAVSGHRPSVDVMFESLSEMGGQAAAVLLTGMGKDGASGLKRIRDRGGWTAAQDKATSVVFGMPKAAQDLGAAQEELALEAVGQRLVQLCQI